MCASLGVYFANEYIYVLDNMYFCDECISVFMGV